MARCKDKSVNRLNELGYNVVRHPRAGILPLDVIGRDGGSARHLGKLVHIWKSTEAAPTIPEPRPAAAVNGVRSSELKLSIGLKILSELLGALGAAVPRVEAAYSKASSLEFAYDNVESIAVEPFLIGQFLSAGDLDSNNPFVTRYFFDEETSAYVLSEVLVSNSLVVTAKDAKGRAIGVDVPAIREVVGVNLAVDAAGAGQSTVQYRGSTSLTIGFKAFEIEFDDGRWQVLGADKAMDLERMAATQGPGAVLLTREPRRINLASL